MRVECRDLETFVSAWTTSSASLRPVFGVDSFYFNSFSLSLSLSYSLRNVTVQNRPRLQSRIVHTCLFGSDGCRRGCSLRVGCGSSNFIKCSTRATWMLLGRSSILACAPWLTLHRPEIPRGQRGTRSRYHFELVATSVQNPKKTTRAERPEVKQI